jgi:aspartyl-tRNA(Asn)/glutamyl-tRNA(Gln) amidotransferase subunit A
LDGAIPLTPSLDSIGVLASTVACCARVDAVLAGEEPVLFDEVAAAGLSFAVPKTMVFDGADDQVTTAFSHAISVLSRAGCKITEILLAEIGELPKASDKCSFHIAEGYSWHRDLLARKGPQYDPFIARRLASGASITAQEYIDLVKSRNDLINRTRIATRGFDAVLMPTVAVVAPCIADVATEAAFRKQSFMIARNAGIVNLLDVCAITLPCHRDGDAPVGLMMMGKAMADQRLLHMARRVETVLAGTRRE